MAEDIILDEVESDQDTVWLTDIDYLTAACSAMDAIEMHSPMTKAGQQRQASAKRKCINIIYYCIDNIYKDVFNKEVEED